MSEGKGHPLPESDEARHNEIPEQLEREKGYGDDGEAAARPGHMAVNPDGEPYPSDGQGREPQGESSGEAQDGEEFQRDQRLHQDRGQSEAESESGSA